jgi:hypothetical protein
MADTTTFSRSRQALFFVSAGLVAAVLIVTALAATHQARAGGADLTIGNVTLRVNEETQLQLEARSVGSPGLAAWAIDIDYNPNVLTPVSCVPATGGLCNLGFGPGTVRVVGADDVGRTGDVVLGTLRFRCDAPGPSALALTTIEFSDGTEGAPQPISPVIAHGSINCVAAGSTDVDEGDANCDGSVNSIDALIVLQYVAGLRNTVPCPEAADVNNDGNIGAVDAALILQIDAGLI